MNAWAIVVLTADRTADLSLVDGLARAHLAAQRFGWAVRVCDASPELVELLDLAGVDLAVEVRR